MLTITEQAMVRELRNLATGYQGPRGSDRKLANILRALQLDDALRTHFTEVVPYAPLHQSSDFRDG